MEQTITDTQKASILALTTMVWVTTSNPVLSLVIGFIMGASIYAHNTGLLSGIWQSSLQYRLRFVEWLKSLRGQENSNWSHMSVQIGYQLPTRKPLFVDITKLGSCGVFAQTGGGKTTLLHTLIHGIISNCYPDEIQLAISDMKDGIDFSIYHRLPHLFCPVAETVEDSEKLLRHLKTEMQRRAKLYRAFSENHLCNDLTRYHALIDTMDVPLERLPYILAIFEEAQDVAKPGTVTERMMIDIAKKGRAYGIHLICATQRNTRGVMTGDLQEQFVTRFVGYMDSNQEYASVGRVPKETYEQMEKLPGRFMMKYQGDWSHIQAKMTVDSELERMAMKVSGNHSSPVWRDTTPIQGKPAKTAWQGTSEQKKALVSQWAQGFTTKPTIDQFLSEFDVQSTSTASKWINEVWYEQNKNV